MSAMHAEVGHSVNVTKTLSESDVYLFAGITGDFSPNHVNEAFMSRSIYGRRVVHGALLIGLISAASARLIDQSLEKGVDSTPVSLGYEGVRFLKPVFMGDTVSIRYTVDAVDAERRRTMASVEVTNQSGNTVAVARHIIKWVRNPEVFTFVA